MALRERLEADGRTLATMKAEFAALQNEALLDPLTNLMNRRGFRHALDQLASRSPNGLTGALLMADIDHFKRINDEHGHLLGDKVLQTVAQVLRSCIKGRDVASRFGGEEFAVLLPDTSEQGALAVAEQIRRTVEQGRMRRSDRGKPIGGVTISIGIAIYRPSDDLEVWIGRADEALYRSKRQGRNRVSVANPSGPQSGLDGRGGEGGGANLSDESSHD
jgi:diguanylate cyclase